MQLGGGVVTPGNINPVAGGGLGYELTIETKVPEIVVSQGTFVDFVGVTHEGVAFTSGPNPTAVVSVYFDSLNNIVGTDPLMANPNVVSGYGNDDGIGAILTGSLLSLTASFDFLVNGPNAGTGTGSFDLIYDITSVDANYLDILTDNVIGIHATGTTNLPSVFFPTAMWDGTVVPYPQPGGPAGILLKVDSSEIWIQQQVPEPSTLILIGAGLLGLAGISRRRKK
jgi:hypothetical protein